MQQISIECVSTGSEFAQMGSRWNLWCRQRVFESGH